MKKIPRSIEVGMLVFIICLLLFSFTTHPLDDLKTDEIEAEENLSVVNNDDSNSTEKNDDVLEDEKNREEGILYWGVFCSALILVIPVIIFFILAVYIKKNYGLKPKKKSKKSESKENKYPHPIWPKEGESDDETGRWWWK